ncbi:MULTISPECIES: 50S ribosomal protein L22 [Weeksella]|uniref:Large ribosomal subunit protein uL22 n=1 Tax=Weeksella virosa (strain ATCC 43766 / DSM 16922 / JCM 21250 / CCUG 30538 / CDC 9751 / IAM 14551 / NBRC 16016 / NCTC 11634 / CL345/78) TaxID=865938 RepID=F0NY82_WEEVC|nr:MULTISPECIES: 50S ribosomal protein L22 [Weeksella]ADX68079.1 ribosomal protein L22 [Weeksella virosa DSM 16922]MDK7374938.1 50S ribosomal protein L22 [Weeksella virosa]MDK7675419.1 50S ribosomal protein L22 [Weeksella virosa]OFM83870.1 50S ribosomal protein L22 [Weeksella sp. HMSC059D05]SUP54390.1 50S ribosomal protein L22 [Weeksella virosa]
MGSRKRLSNQTIKEANKKIAFAKLNNVPTSPRKMRLVADIIRGEEIQKALGILKYSKQHASISLEKLLLSAIANWQVKNEGSDVEDAGLYVKTITVDSARQLKRIRTAPQGRAHRIRKRSNHVTIVLGTKEDKQKVEDQ